MLFKIKTINTYYLRYALSIIQKHSFNSSIIISCLEKFGKNILNEGTDFVLHVLS